MLKYGVFSGPYLLVFELNAEKYGPEKIPYLDIFHAVITYQNPLTDASDQPIHTSHRKH